MMTDHAPIRLVAIDLDGTLLDSSKQVCPLAAVSLLQLGEQGIKVVIASARPPRSVRHIYQCLGIDTWQINYNGAMIWDEPGRRVVQHLPLAGERVLQMALAARAKFPQVQVSCEILDRWYTDHFDPVHTTETGRLFPPDVIAPLDAFCNQPVTKLMLLGNARMMSALEADLANDPDIYLVHSDPDLIQIVSAMASKAAALKFAAEHYGVAMENVLAIGDAANDIPMLQAAGVGVAMDNADAAVKAAADWIAPSNNDHGVHAALVRFGLV